MLGIEGWPLPFAGSSGPAVLCRVEMKAAIRPVVPLRAGLLPRRLPQLTRLGHESDTRYGWPHLRPARARPPTTPPEEISIPEPPLSRPPPTPPPPPAHLLRP